MQYEIKTQIYFGKLKLLIYKDMQCDLVPHKLLKIIISINTWT